MKGSILVTKSLSTMYYNTVQVKILLADISNFSDLNIWIIGYSKFNSSSSSFMLGLSLHYNPHGSIIFFIFFLCVTR